MADVAKLDAGRAFWPRFKGVRVPTLDQVLAVVPRTVEMNVHVNPGPSDVEELVRQVCATLRQGNRMECAFVTGNEAVMEAVIADTPTARRCMGSRPASTHAHYGCYGIQPTNSDTTGALVKEAHEAGRLVWPFFANDPAEMRRLIACGVDGILTDKPADLLALRTTAAL